MLRRSVIAWLVVGVALGVAYPVAQAQSLTPCTSKCANITVGGASGTAGSTVNLPVSFTQAPADADQGKGNDDIAAVAMTIGIGSLRLTVADCEDINGDGLPDAVTVSNAILNDPVGFRVVVENYQCTSRKRCLCPTAQDETRDSFVNVVVYGPKDLPAQGPVPNIPKLPDGELFTIRVQIPGGTTQNVPVHVYAETDNQGTDPKPQFGAFLSIGDQAAIDETADRGANVSKVTVGNATVTVTGSVCAGNCNPDVDNVVKINELILGVGIALGNGQLSACPSFDTNDNKKVDINELIKGVSNALNGCGS